MCVHISKGCSYIQPQRQPFMMSDWCTLDPGPTHVLRFQSTNVKTFLKKESGSCHWDPPEPACQPGPLRFMQQGRQRSCCPVVLLCHPAPGVPCCSGSQVSSTNVYWAPVCCAYPYASLPPQLRTWVVEVPYCPQGHQPGSWGIINYFINRNYLINM